MARLELIIVAGPTGSGKSDLAIQIALHLRKLGQKCEILCADSIAHYQGFNIGSAKPDSRQLALVPHHLLDICPAHSNFTAGDFITHAVPLIEQLHAQKIIPLLVGGTGFYIKALLQGMATEERYQREAKFLMREKLEAHLVKYGLPALYEKMLALDPDLASQIHCHDQYRILRALEAMELSGERWSVLNQIAKTRRPRYEYSRFFCLHLTREILLSRIIVRTQAMLRMGLVTEVKNLLNMGIPPKAKPFQSIGYRQCLEYLGLISPPPQREAPKNLQELEAAIVRETMRLAKNQMTWFRSQAKDVIWVDGSNKPLTEIVDALATAL